MQRRVAHHKAINSQLCQLQAGLLTCQLVGLSTANELVNLPTC